MVRDVGEVDIAEVGQRRRASRETVEGVPFRRIKVGPKDVDGHCRALKVDAQAGLRRRVRDRVEIGRVRVCAEGWVDWVARA